jgi:hypothetical protein
MALLEAAMLGAAVARRLDVTLSDPSRPVDELSNFVVEPSGLRVRFSPASPS